MVKMLSIPIWYAIGYWNLAKIQRYLKNCMSKYTEKLQKCNPVCSKWSRQVSCDAAENSWQYNDLKFMAIFGF